MNANDEHDARWLANAYAACREAEMCAWHGLGSWELCLKHANGWAAEVHDDSIRSIAFERIADASRHCAAGLECRAKLLEVPA